MIKGSIVALVTPFNKDGSVNFDTLKDLLDFHLENETDGILVLGTTGESSTMTHEEDDAVAQFTLDHVAGRVPVVVGAGSNCTETAISKATKYANMGADALLMISPYYNKANKKGMLHHFTDVADVTKCPIIVYNVPGRTGCSITVDVVEQLAKHPNVCGIKEASGSIQYASDVARFISDDFAMWSGNDDMILPIMALGGSGVISVMANILPKETHDIAMSYLEGDVQKSRELQLKYLDLIHALFIEVNPIPVKEAMNIMGLNAGSYRMPLCEMDDANREKLMASMRKVGLCR